MEQNRINYEYHQIKKIGAAAHYDPNPTPVFNFIFWFILISAALSVVIWFLAEIIEMSAKVGPQAWWIVVPVVVIGLAITANQMTAGACSSKRQSLERQFFNNPDNHTHDDECETCGGHNMFGPPVDYGRDFPAAVRNMAWVCRHASGKMNFPQ